MPKYSLHCSALLSCAGIDAVFERKTYGQDVDLRADFSVWLAQTSMVVLAAATGLMLVSTVTYEGNLRNVAVIGSYVPAAQASANYIWLLRVRTLSLLFMRPERCQAATHA